MGVIDGASVAVRVGEGEGEAVGVGVTEGLAVGCADALSVVKLVASDSTVRP